MKKLITYSYIVLFLPLSIAAQPILPLNNYLTRQADDYIISNAIPFNSFVKPYSHALLQEKLPADSVLDYFKISQSNSSWFNRKLLHENLFTADTGSFRLTIDPLFNFQLGKDLKTNKNYYTNTRGIKVSANIGKRLSFESTFYENQAIFPDYIDTFILYNQVVPGQGFARKFKTNGWDYNYSSAEMWLRASKRITLALGQGKQFIGDGYRSLLLSDNTFNYPFLNFMYTGEKIHYTHIYTVFMNVSSQGSPFSTERKLGSFSVLSFLPNYWLELSLFEGNIFEYPNAKKDISFNANYLNPLILVNTLTKVKNMNSLTGAGAKINMARTAQLYGQFAVSNVSDNSTDVSEKYAFQIGCKYYNALTIRNLYLQAEYNYASPFIYSFGQANLNYSHYNQAIAHPLGNNFKEAVFIIQYQYRRFVLENQVNYSTYKTDPTLTAISKLKVDHYFIGQQKDATLFYWDSKISFLLNPKTNMNVMAGYTQRDLKSNGTQEPFSCIYVGFRTSLTNLYSDF